MHCRAPTHGTDSKMTARRKAVHCGRGMCAQSIHDKLPPAARERGRDTLLSENSRGPLWLRLLEVPRGIPALLAWGWQKWTMLERGMEKAMTTQSNTLAWKIPWKEEPGGLQSMGSPRVKQLSDFTFNFHFHALEKEMATHSSVLAWRIPGTEEPGGLPSMGSHRVRHN